MLHILHESICIQVIFNAMHQMTTKNTRHIRKISQEEFSLWRGQYARYICAIIIHQDRALLPDIV